MQRKRSSTGLTEHFLEVEILLRHVRQFTGSSCNKELDTDEQADTRQEA